MTIGERLAADLRGALAAEHVEVVDQSDRHRGHAGALEGGHYDATIVSARFAGLGLVARHRAVYAVLGDLRERRIHALVLQTFTPEEWRARGR
ncbi:MAG: hypothetical protein B6D46_07145 [Polyangiaceae bacterium UTPRO1]|jgi:BolA protein|nr:BolA family transcriptional regulator [Myxococcales bacterium]OQY67801.1 MAG: hypothetical protein B6D46_07145 [Polyangiaceae bacterium UTPRO1]